MPNFIREQFLENTALCDLLINYHVTSEYKGAGAVYHNNKKQIIPEEKDSVDCVLNTNDALFAEYAKNLQIVINEYIKQYPMCNYYNPWGITDVVNIQHYKPTAGYHVWHTERATCIEPSSSRHLVFMTYLNDVTDGGETEFYHQGIKVKPEKGKTLIWPSDWTHTHRGISSPTQEKYIITGWFNFLPR